MKKLFYVLLLFLFSCSKSSDQVKPVRKNIIETVYASGKIIAANEYTVYALSNGTIKEKLVREGDAVVKNQKMFIINADAPSARLDAARSNYENAQLNLSSKSHILNDLSLALQNARVKFTNDSLQYSRLKNLLTQNAATQNTVDNALVNYTVSQNQKKSAEEKYFSARNDLTVALKNAKSLLTNAESDLNNYYIKSDRAGTVFQTLKEAGEAVRAGEPVALLGETSQRIIKLAVDQQDINKIKTGQEVLLKTDATGNTIFHGSISRIYPVMNEVDQTFRVDAVFNDSLGQRYIHSSVEANIIIRQQNNALIIPRKALVADDSVQVKQDGNIKTIAVETGIRTLDDVEIVKGLDESSLVVLPSQK